MTGKMMIRRKTTREEDVKEPTQWYATGTRFALETRPNKNKFSITCRWFQRTDARRFPKGMRTISEIANQNFLKTNATSLPMPGEYESDPSTVRPSSDHEPINPQPSPRNPPGHQAYFSCPSPESSVENPNISCSRYHSQFDQIIPTSPNSALPQKTCVMRLPRQVTAAPHQILQVPQKLFIFYFFFPLLFSTPPFFDSTIFKSTISWLYYYLPLLLFYLTILWLYIFLLYPFTLPFFTMLFFYSAGLLLCHFLTLRFRS